MKLKLLSLALIAGLAAPLAASAADVSYTYVEGGYSNIDGDADGAYVRGSVNFGDSGFYGLGSYSYLETDVGNISLRPAELGVGYHYGLSQGVDLIGEAAYVRVDTDFGDIDGYRGSVGVRGNLASKVEGLAKVNYTDGDDFDGDFSGTLGAQYKFNNTWGLTGEVEFGRDSTTAYLVGVRASF